MTFKYIFHNHTPKPFTGYWNGKPYTFKPGVKKYYPKGIAEHFAKHLTNEILTATKRERMTSPKKPLEVPEFMKEFNKALLIEEIPDKDNLDIDAESIVDSDVPSMNIKIKPTEPIDPYNANAQPQTGPGQHPQDIHSGANETTDKVNEESLAKTSAPVTPPTPPPTGTPTLTNSPKKTSDADDYQSPAENK